jgi:iduronate 2-sulfatase
MKWLTVVLAVLLTAPGVFAKKNVLLIMTDDLNDYLGAYGHPVVQTPNIDKLAAGGMTFQNAYCQFALCGPSRNSMMSGLYPDQTGLYDLRTLLRDHVPDAVTMSQYFMNNGYTAARVGKIFHYDNPGAIGTNGHDDPLSWNVRVNPKGRDKDIEEQGLIEAITDKKSYGAQLSWYADPTGRDEEHTDGMVATESIKLMQKFVKEGQPFFLAVGFFKPHTPYISPKKYFDLYDSSTIKVPTVPDGYFDTIPKPAVKSLISNKSEFEMPDETAKKAIQAYWAAISFLDAQVGRLLDALDQTGQRDNTIILFSSDHGYHMGEHKHYKKTTLFEESDRVPLIVAAPGMKHRGEQTGALVEMVDFYPTLSELAGLPRPGKIAGVSFAPVLQDPAARVRDSALTQLKNGNGYSIRTDRYRYTRWEEGGEDMIELYDWQSDPDEMKNLARNPEHKNLVAKMDAVWQERVSAAKARPKGLRFVQPPSEKPKEKTGKKQKK